MCESKVREYVKHLNSLDADRTYIVRHQLVHGSYLHHESCNNVGHIFSRNWREIETCPHVPELVRQCRAIIIGVAFFNQHSVQSPGSLSLGAVAPLFAPFRLCLVALICKVHQVITSAGGAAFVFEAGPLVGLVKEFVIHATNARVHPTPVGVQVVPETVKIMVSQQACAGGIHYLEHSSNKCMVRMIKLFPVSEKGNFVFKARHSSKLLFFEYL